MDKISSLIFHPKRLQNQAQLDRLISVEQYCRSQHLSRSATMGRIYSRKVWATKIDRRIWIDPEPL
jgi:hypothetical protein